MSTRTDDPAALPVEVTVQGAEERVRVLVIESENTPEHVIPWERVVHIDRASVYYDAPDPEDEDGLATITRMSGAIRIYVDNPRAEKSRFAPEGVTFNSVSHLDDRFHMFVVIPDRGDSLRSRVVLLSSLVKDLVKAASDGDG